MNTWTKRVSRRLDLTLTVDERSYSIDEYDESGDSYGMVFSRSENMDEVAHRIGMEILSWFDLMTDELDELPDDSEK